jgi:curved DNA-binding protein CbpA
VEELKELNNDQQLSLFRKTARLLHPDKNFHPEAKESFQKFSQAFNEIRNLVSF